MATSPQFASSPIVGSAVLSSSAETSYTSPTHATLILSAASFTVASVTTTSGSQIATTSSSLVSVLPGQYVAGTGIAAGTTVIAVVGTSIYLSIAATASGSVTLTFQTNGVKIDEVDFIGIGSTTGTPAAGNCVLYLLDASSTYHAYFTQAVTATAAFFQAQPFTNFEIPAGWSLYASFFAATANLNVVAFGGSL